jgi:hypothetical protein
MLLAVYKYTSTFMCEVILALKLTTHRDNIRNKETQILQVYFM